MSDKEAIKILQFQATMRFFGEFSNNDRMEALNLAIAALQDVQKYKDEIKSLKEEVRFYKMKG